jgi:predicted site-specific integrase-resolvase
MRKGIPAIADNAVLTRTELCEALAISPRTLDELVASGVIPVCRLTRTTPRFIYGQVVEAIARLAQPADTLRRVS